MHSESLDRSKVSAHRPPCMMRAVLQAHTLFISSSKIRTRLAPGFYGLPLRRPS